MVEKRLKRRDNSCEEDGEVGEWTGGDVVGGQQLYDERIRERASGSFRLNNNAGGGALEGKDDPMRGRCRDDLILDWTRSRRSLIAGVRPVYLHLSVSVEASNAKSKETETSSQFLLVGPLLEEREGCRGMQCNAKHRNVFTPQFRPSHGHRATDPSFHSHSPLLSIQHSRKRAVAVGEGDEDPQRCPSTGLAHPRCNADDTAGPVHDPDGHGWWARKRTVDSHNCYCTREPAMLREPSPRRERQTAPKALVPSAFGDVSSSQASVFARRENACAGLEG